MPTVTQHAPGTFCWPELATTDQEGAKKFYSSLFGWDAQDQEMGGGEKYTMLKLKGRDVGALYKLRKEQANQNVPPHWGSYVAVDSADQSAAKARQLGGTVMADPFDVFDIGRMAIVQDPTGAIFCLWEARKHIGAGVLDETGALCWTELLTAHPDQAQAFYTGLLPWTTQTMNAGPAENQVPYTIFKRGDTMAGGMMKIMPQMGPIPPHWLPYFQVENSDATVAKAQSLGARVHVPPMDIPNVGRFSVMSDPQGASFAVIAFPNR